MMRYLITVWWFFIILHFFWGGRCAHLRDDVEITVFLISLEMISCCVIKPSTLFTRLIHFILLLIFKGCLLSWIFNSDKGEWYLLQYFKYFAFFLLVCVAPGEKFDVIHTYLCLLYGSFSLFSISLIFFSLNDMLTYDTFGILYMYIYRINVFLDTDNKDAWCSFNFLDIWFSCYHCFGKILVIITSSISALFSLLFPSVFQSVTVTAFFFFSRFLSYTL